MLISAPGDNLGHTLDRGIRVIRYFPRDCAIKPGRMDGQHGHMSIAPGFDSFNANCHKRFIKTQCGRWLLEYAVRFLAGGLIVSAFAILADVLRPKSFAGL